jgi:hypothetical protein
LHQARSGLNHALLYTLDYRAQEQFALSQYTKAVNQLRCQIEGSNSEPQVDLVLLSCLLFVGFEMLQGNILLALDHLQNGLSIIQQHFQRNLDSYAQCKATTQSDKLIDELVPAFARIDYVSLLEIKSIENTDKM